MIIYPSNIHPMSVQPVTTILKANNTWPEPLHPWTSPQWSQMSWWRGPPSWGWKENQAQSSWGTRPPTWDSGKENHSQADSTRRRWPLQAPSYLVILTVELARRRWSWRRRTLPSELNSHEPWSWRRRPSSMRSWRKRELLRPEPGH